jgi:hypothetical protein
MSICKCSHSFAFHDHGWRQKRCYKRGCKCPGFRKSWLRSLGK